MSYYSRNDDRELKVLVRALLYGAIAGIAFGLLTSCAHIDKLPSVDICKIQPQLCVPSPTPTPTPTPVPEPTPGATPTPTPSPTPSPDILGHDDPLPELSSGRTKEEGAQALPSFTSALNRAIDIACGRCDNGYELQSWQAFVMTVRDTIRQEGFGANYDWEHGELGGLGSELSIWRGGRYESHQIVTTAKRVRRPTGSFRGEGTLKTPAARCPLQHPLPVTIEVGLRLGPYAGQQYDATPYIQDRGHPIWPPAAWTGACRAHQCDLALDKDYENGRVCTEDLCGENPEWSFIGAGILNRTDGYRAKVTVDGGPSLLTVKCTQVEARASLVLAP